MTDPNVCGRCGAAVGDKSKHEAWHKRLDTERETAHARMSGLSRRIEQLDRRTIGMQVIG